MLDMLFKHDRLKTIAEGSYVAVNIAGLPPGAHTGIDKDGNPYNPGYDTRLIGITFIGVDVIISDKDHDEHDEQYYWAKLQTKLRHYLNLNLLSSYNNGSPNNLYDIVTKPEYGGVAWDSLPKSLRPQRRICKELPDDCPEDDVHYNKSTSMFSRWPADGLAVSLDIADFTLYSHADWGIGTSYFSRHEFPDRIELPKATSPYWGPRVGFNFIDLPWMGSVIWGGTLVCEHPEHLIVYAVG